ncbi:MAG TPA: hypothetical protein PL180_02060 [Spirochaetota bacterium]|nr:hypothetical protein [Spirochaetota bacterium]
MALSMYRTTSTMLTAASLLALSCSGLMAYRDRSATDLESELAVLKKQVNMIEKKNALLEAENSDRKERLKRLKNDCAVQKAEADARIRDLAGMNARLKADYAETSARLNAAIAALEKELGEKNEELSRKESALRDLQSAADRMKAELIKKDAEISLGDKKNRDLVSEIEKLKATIDKNDLLLKEREAALRSLRGEVDSLNSSLKDKSAEITGLKSKLETLEANKTNVK